jgi:hypothetical protein
VLVIILGVPSTIISSEYWMSSNSTPFGPAYATPSSIELANFVNQNVPITSRVATSGDMSNAIIKLAGGTTAVSTCIQICCFHPDPKPQHCFHPTLVLYVR